MPRISAGDGRKRDFAVMNRSTRITVQLNVDELAKVDEIRGALSRPAFVRSLLRAAGPSGGNVATHKEAMAILTALARDGKMPAAISLERALRGADGAAADDAEFAAYDEMAGRRAGRG